MITLSEVKKNPYILEFIEQTENVLKNQDILSMAWSIQV